MEVVFRPKEGCRERFELLLDGEKWREVHRTIFGRRPSLPGSESREQASADFDLLEYQRVKGYVLWRLSSQSYHSEHLAHLLRSRLVQVKTIERVLKECKEKGMLDDEAWLRGFVKGKVRRYGLSAVVSQLRAKGLSSSTLQQVREEWSDPQEEIEAIRRLLETKYRLKELSDYKTRQKVIAALIRRGYAFEQVQQALSGNGS